MAWGGTNSTSPVPMGRLAKRQGFGAWRDDERQGAYFETREFQTGWKEKQFPHDDSQAVEQTA